MNTTIFYVTDCHTGNILFMAKVNNNLINAYEKHLKGQYLKMAVAPSFEFSESNGYGKFTIENKSDF